MYTLADRTKNNYRTLRVLFTHAADAREFEAVAQEMIDAYRGVVRGMHLAGRVDPLRVVVSIPTHLGGVCDESLQALANSLREKRGA